MLRRLYLVSLLALTALTSCNEDLVSNMYCRLYANFSYNFVSTVHQLYTACNSPGEWCTITARNNEYIFTNLTGSTPVQKTAAGNYSGFYLGLSGFIVGRPNIPEMGYDTSIVTCYDLACSNCYHNIGLARALTMMDMGRAHCKTCGRTYNLNNLGSVMAGEAGINLYRYRVTYTNNTLVINNH